MSILFFVNYDISESVSASLPSSMALIRNAWEDTNVAQYARKTELN